MEARDQELERLLEEQIAAVEAAFADEMQAQEEKDAIARDSCLAPENEAANADAIFHQPAVPLRALNARISPELERIILKCLQKEPENRYQSAAELEVDLRQLTTLDGARPTTAARR
jgi:serine/threonine protein kinase